MIFQAHTRNNYLTEIATDGSLVPELAESWEASPDAKVWTFKIREGVDYHSGHRLVAGGRDRVDRPSPRRRLNLCRKAPIVADVVDMKADGMNVIVTLANGNADFPFVLSDYHLPILPAKDGKIDPETRDGCGPFRIVDLEFGVGARYERHDGYWKSGLPYIDAIEQFVIHDDAARQNALISGEVNYIDTVDLNTVSLLGRAAGIEILSVTGTQHYGLPMDTRAAPFDDVNVRLALKYAINRQQLVDHDPERLRLAWQRPSDRTRARASSTPTCPRRNSTLTSRSSTSSRQASTASASTSTLPTRLSRARSMRASCSRNRRLRPAGINLNVVREPNDGYWSNVWMQKPFVGTYWGGRPTEDWMFATAYAEGVPWNETYWSHERFNELLISARSGTRREPASRDVFRDAADRFGRGWNHHSDVRSLCRRLQRRLGQPDQVASNWRNDGHRIGERWWFA